MTLSPIAERRPHHGSGAQRKTAAKRVGNTVPCRADEATKNAVAALRRAERQRGRQGRLPRHLSYRRGDR
jgi:hypothetical protein